jgi:voltage-gated potassium channel
VDERSRRVEQLLQIPLAIAALLTIPVIAIEESATNEPWQTIGTVLNWATWLVFLAELVIMLAVVPNRWRWIRTHKLDVIITVLTPPVMPPGLQSLRALRLLRLLRLARLGPIARRLFTGEGLRLAGFLALAVVFGGGVAFYSAEHRTQHVGLGDSIWWAATTMTTVGYGDLFPKTTMGRFVGVTVMVVGIGLLALLTGAVAEQFLKAEVAETEETGEQVEQEAAGVEDQLREVNDRLDRLEALIARDRG